MRTNPAEIHHFPPLRPLWMHGRIHRFTIHPMRVGAISISNRSDAIFFSLSAYTRTHAHKHTHHESTALSAFRKRCRDSCTIGDVQIYSCSLNWTETWSTSFLWQARLQCARLMVAIWNASSVVSARREPKHKGQLIIFLALVDTHGSTDSSFTDSSRQRCVDCHLVMNKYRKKIWIIK